MNDVFLFEGFRFDRSGTGLGRRDANGHFVPVAIGSRALDILGVLLERPGELVSRDEIMTAVWPRTVVEDSNLTVHISALRRVLDQGRSQGSCIQTVAARGYRFVGEVTRQAKSASGAAPGGATDTSANPRSFRRTISSLILRPRRRRLWVSAAAMVIVLSGLVVSRTEGWWHGAGTDPADLSFVVLPFANLSNDPDQDYFVDAITDDLTTDLSRLPGSFVIARGTAFTFKGKPVEARQLGREFGVRYVVEGSVRRAGERVVVNVDLVEAKSATRLWANRFEVDRLNLTEAQREITGRLAKTLNVKLIEAASRRSEQERPTDPDARDLWMRGQARFNRGPMSPATIREAMLLDEQALQMDPGLVDAKTAIAAMLIAYLANGWSSSIERDEARAEELLRDALEHDPNDAQARKILGILRRVQGRLTEAQIELETSIAVDPNDTFSLRNLGSTLVQMGRPEAAIPYIEKSIRLSPQDPFIAPNYSWLGMCHVLLGHSDQAIEFLKKAWTANPRHASYRLWLAGALGLKGEIEEAKAAIADAAKLSPAVDTIERFRASTPFAADTAYWALRDNTVEAGLRRAGFPER